MKQLINQPSKAPRIHLQDLNVPLAYLQSLPGEWSGTGQVGNISTGSPFMDKGKQSAFLKRCSCKRAGKLLKLSRNQLRLLTGQMQTGIWNGLACSLWLCQALVVLRLTHLDLHFVKPGDFADISISKVLQYFKVQGWRMHELTGCTKDWKQSRYKSHCSAHPNALYSNLHKLTVQWKS